MVIPEGPDGPDGRSALTDAPIRAPAVIDDRSIATVKRVRFAEKLLDYCDNIIMERADTGRASEDSYHEGDEGRIDTYDEGEDTDDEWEPIARPCSSPKGAAGPGDGAGRSGKGVLPAAVAEPEDSDQNHHEEKNQRKEPLPPPPAVGGREEDDEHIGEDYDDESKEKDEDAAGHQEGQGRHQSLFAALRRDAELLPPAAASPPPRDDAEDACCYYDAELPICSRLRLFCYNAIIYVYCNYAAIYVIVTTLASALTWCGCKSYDHCFCYLYELLLVAVRLLHSAFRSPSAATTTSLSSDNAVRRGQWFSRLTLTGVVRARGVMGSVFPHSGCSCW